MENNTPNPPNPGNDPPQPRRWWRTKKFAGWAVAFLLVWGLAAYLLMPVWWRVYVHRHPALADIPHIAHTGTGIPGDPINVGLVGSETEITTMMVAAKWYPADPLTLESCLKIAQASALKRPYDSAPVSNLYLWGRKQDLAFEQPVGDNPRQRHHVRFWRSEKVDENGRPLWAGAAIFDRRVELSRTTGQITHQTDGNIDAERDYLFTDLAQTGDLADTYIVDNFHTTRTGRNGGGDPWFTDGRLFVGLIALK